MIMAKEIRIVSRLIQYNCVVSAILLFSAVLIVITSDNFKKNNNDTCLITLNIEVKYKKKIKK